MKKSKKNKFVQFSFEERVKIETLLGENISNILQNISNHNFASYFGLLKYCENSDLKEKVRSILEKKQDLDIIDLC